MTDVRGFFFYVNAGHFDFHFQRKCHQFPPSTKVAEIKKIKSSPYDYTDCVQFKS